MEMIHEATKTGGYDLKVDSFVMYINNKIIN